MKHTEIIISGGGIAGLTTAILLGQAGFDVCLVDPALPGPLKDTYPTGRTVALMSSSLHVLSAAGVWPDLHDDAGRLAIMRIIDVSMSEPVEAEFYASDIGQDEFGYNIPNTIVRAALYEKARMITNITVYETALKTIEQNPHKITVKLENGETVTGAVLIGADGRNSAVRSLSSVKVSKKNYDQVAITGLIHHSRSHNNTATEFHKPGGPLALVPLPGNTSSFVWVEKTQKAREIERLRKPDFEQALQNQTRNILGGVTLEGGLASWPLSSFKVKSLIAPRTALVAEAAHAMSPVTAQGLNLSLRDVAVLAEALVDARRAGLDIGSASTLSNYERRRRADMNTRVLGVDAMNTIVGVDVQALKALRRAGLKTVDRIFPLKTWAMKHGLAPSLDLGRLAKGQKL